MESRSARGGHGYGQRAVVSNKRLQDPHRKGARVIRIMTTERVVKIVRVVPDMFVRVGAQNKGDLAVVFHLPDEEEIFTAEMDLKMPKVIRVIIDIIIRVNSM